MARDSDSERPTFGADDSDDSPDGSEMVGVFHRLRAFLPFELPDAASEGETERDGAFSYAYEWHAFLFGVAGGILVAHDPQYLSLVAGIVATAFGVDTVGKATAKVPDYVLSQIRDEVHYFTGGVLAGYHFIVYAHGGDGHWLLPQELFDLLAGFL